MNPLINNLLNRLINNELEDTSIISWSSPVPSFGDVSNSIIATVGLNPSNLEFVDSKGIELDGADRRFHTLRSLDITNWQEIETHQIDSIVQLCNEYFLRNPYDRWFKKLDYIISGTSFSYYFPSIKACHIDLVPYATFIKWGELSKAQQKQLLNLVGDTLGLLLKDSPIRFLVLNGKSVLDNFSSISDAKFEQDFVPDWTLPRKDKNGVPGYSYKGTVSQVGGINLRKELKVFGFNHNIQSSFGVTKQIQRSIRKWIANEVQNHLEQYA